MPLFQGAQRHVEYLFVDGAALRETMTAVGEFWWPGHVAPLCWNTIGQGFEKAFYYDAYPVRREGQDEAAFEALCLAHDELMDEISSHSGWHAYAGEARHRRRRGLEQKMVDVMIAVDALRHTFNGNMSRCTLLTNDLDFKPLLDALVQEGMHVTLWHSRQKTSRDLRRSADVLRELGPNALWTLTNEAFRAAHPLPRAYSGPWANHANRVAMERGQLENGDDWILWSADETGTQQLIWPSRDNPGMFMIVEDRDRLRILRYANEVFGLSINEAE